MLSVLIGSDHAGFALKTELVLFLKKKGLSLEDQTPILTPGDDYPEIARKVASRIAHEKTMIGILVCGSGIGMDMAANRIKGARAALVRTIVEAKLARKDDHANILVLGGRITSPAIAKRIATAFLFTPYSTTTRHIRRVKKLDV